MRPSVCTYRVTSAKNVGSIDLTDRCVLKSEHVPLTINVEPLKKETELAMMGSDTIIIDTD